jgi:hypothetical protein
MAAPPAISADPAPSVPGPHDDPIESIFADLIGKLNHLASQPGAKLTCDDLMGAVGPHSHVLAIFVFSLLNLLPAPPGYNFVMALIIVILSIIMLMGKEIKLWRVFGRMKLPMKPMSKLLGWLATLTSWIARISSPRLLHLTSPAARPVIALVGIVLGVVMLVPIPFTNMLPSIGLAMICVGQLNRDGLLVLAGVIVGVLGLAVMAAAIWAVALLAFAIEDVVD